MSTRKTVRLFVAHAKSDNKLEALQESLRADLTARWPQETHLVTLTLGRDYYTERFAKCGSWDAWTRDIAERTLGPSQDVCFHGVVVPRTYAGDGSYVGKATAQILEHFLRLKKPALAWRKGILERITAVNLGDGNYQTGWSIAATPFWNRSAA